MATAFTVSMVGIMVDTDDNYYTFSTWSLVLALERLSLYIFIVWTSVTEKSKIHLIRHSSTALVVSFARPALVHCSGGGVLHLKLVYSFRDSGEYHLLSQTLAYGSGDHSKHALPSRIPDGWQPTPGHAEPFSTRTARMPSP